ncbi:MAG: methyltransferase [Candidatus Nanoarchaeia archaeon]|jgi:HemK-related putative methylase|nr:methyltransferase [Candidatus Nanoarchaeia archaeon]MDD3993604.1 methyltransferase [Candidatus Nanoarchaeia archaeon]MDD4563410.1 methyltransferase [Candidatus Nanoarchaeia archaeon]
MSLIYEPAEDSFLFSNFLEDYFEGSNNKNKKILDMGCGSCILSETMRDLDFEDILCVDINLDCIKLAKEKGFRAIKSNLFSNIDERFDFICFNAPYLPFDELEDEESSIATSGGKRGDEIVLNFLKNLNNFLNDNGIAFVLISSLTPMENINKYHFKIVSKKRVFFEELYILEFKKESFINN